MQRGRGGFVLSQHLHGGAGADGRARPPGDLDAHPPARRLHGPEQVGTVLDFVTLDIGVRFVIMTFAKMKIWTLKIAEVPRNG